METYSGKLYLPNGSLKLTTIQKLADAGLAFSTPHEIYTKSTVCIPWVPIYATEFAICFRYFHFIVNGSVVNIIPFNLDLNFRLAL